MYSFELYTASCVFNVASHALVMMINSLLHYTVHLVVRQASNFSSLEEDPPLPAYASGLIVTGTVVLLFIGVLGIVLCCLCYRQANDSWHICRRNLREGGGGGGASAPGKLMIVGTSVVGT